MDGGKGERGREEKRRAEKTGSCPPTFALRIQIETFTSQRALRSFLSRGARACDDICTVTFVCTHTHTLDSSRKCWKAISKATTRSLLSWTFEDLKPVELL